MICMPSGPVPAGVMLVGEAPGEWEERQGEPFVGPSGQELNRMLHEVGIMRSQCFVTNVCRIRPPNNDIGQFVALKKKDITSRHVAMRDKFVLPVVQEGYDLLQKEIALVQPRVIIAFGNLALWALTGAWGIAKWRGSVLGVNGVHREGVPVVIPTYHPAFILRQWDLRATSVLDLRRAKRYLDGSGPRQPEWRFTVRPSYQQVTETLLELKRKLDVSQVWIDFDLETRAGHIACAGLSWSKLDALIIPFMCVENREGYWPPEQEAAIVHLLYLVLTHRNVLVRWQNGLYDAQYTYRHWHFIPRGAQDTMISQHTMWCILPKSLAFQASMYCDHYVYWKDEGKTWDQGIGEEQLWRYNGIDCVRTREVGEVMAETIRGMGLEQVEAFQQAMFWPVLRAMNRGVRVDLKVRQEMAQLLMTESAKREKFLTDVLGHPINPRSSKQLIQLFYGDLKQKEIWTRPKKGAPSHLTCDDEALTTIGQREPLLRPITNAIADIRTLDKLHNDFVLMPLDQDGRMRCSFNIAGNTEGRGAPATYRLSSSKSAFDTGGNLQTIPSDKSKSMGKMARRGTAEFPLPNIRTMYVPDPGYTFFDADLDRADIHAMAWDAEDEVLKEVLRQKVDIHLFNVYVLDGQEPPPMDELVESHPKYPDHRGPRKHKREFAKVFCHATDYLGRSRTLAALTGKTVHEVDRAQAVYLGRYQGIKKWQERICRQVEKFRFVENAFGYRWYIFSRIDDSVMPEAVAWIPQSVVGVYINKIWKNIYDNLPEVEVLLQVHDSLAGQFPTHRKHILLPRMAEEAAKVIVPHDDPLVIPFSIGTSEISWGHCG